jgi:hypothetical protein
MRRPPLPAARAASAAGALGAALLATRPAALPAQGLDGYGGGPKIYLSQDSSRFLRVTLWSQVWTRWQQMNPGTMVNNNPGTAETKDLGIRRTRVLMHGQITPRILVFWILGVNNQTFTTGGLNGGDWAPALGRGRQAPAGLRHDSWGEFA